MFLLTWFMVHLWSSVSCQSKCSFVCLSVCPYFVYHWSFCLSSDVPSILYSSIFCVCRPSFVRITLVVRPPDQPNDHPFVVLLSVAYLSVHCLSVHLFVGIRPSSFVGPSCVYFWSLHPFIIRRSIVCQLFVCRSYAARLFVSCLTFVFSVRFVHLKPLLRSIWPLGHVRLSRIIPPHIVHRLKTTDEPTDDREDSLKTISWTNTLFDV